MQGTQEGGVAGKGRNHGLRRGKTKEKTGGALVEGGSLESPSSQTVCDKL